MEVPDRYLTQILANLVAEGLLKAVAGPDGGYSLARSPESITLLDVVQAAEGQITLDECVLSGGPCEWEEACPPSWTWQGSPPTSTLEPTKDRRAPCPTRRGRGEGQR